MWKAGGTFFRPEVARFTFKNYNIFKPFYTFLNIVKQHHCMSVWLIIIQVHAWHKRDIHCKNLYNEYIVRWPERPATELVDNVPWSREIIRSPVRPATDLVGDVPWPGELVHLLARLQGQHLLFYLAKYLIWQRLKKFGGTESQLEINLKAKHFYEKDTIVVNIRLEKQLSQVIEFLISTKQT